MPRNIVRGKNKASLKNTKPKLTKAKIGRALVDRRLFLSASVQGTHITLHLQQEYDHDKNYSLISKALHSIYYHSAEFQKQFHPPKTCTHPPLLLTLKAGHNLKDGNAVIAALRDFAIMQKRFPFRQDLSKGDLLAGVTLDGNEVRLQLKAPYNQPEVYHLVNQNFYKLYLKCPEFQDKFERPRMTHRPPTLKLKDKNTYRHSQAALEDLKTFACLQPQAISQPPKEIVNNDVPMTPPLPARLPISGNIYLAPPAEWTVSPCFVLPGSSINASTNQANYSLLLPPTCLIPVMNYGISIMPTLLPTTLQGAYYSPVPALKQEQTNSPPPPTNTANTVSYPSTAVLDIGYKAEIYKKEADPLTDTITADQKDFYIPQEPTTMPASPHTDALLFIEPQDSVEIKSMPTASTKISLEKSPLRTSWEWPSFEDEKDFELDDLLETSSQLITTLYENFTSQTSKPELEVWRDPIVNSNIRP